MKTTPQNLQETIRAQAYLLSEKAGHPPGMSEAFWCQAEAIVLEWDGAPKEMNPHAKKVARKAAARKGPKRAKPQNQKKNAGRARVLASR